MEGYPATQQPEMDPMLRSKIIAFAEDGHDLERLEEVFGTENVRQAVMNNPYLQELIDPAGKGAYAP